MNQAISEENNNYHKFLVPIVVAIILTILSAIAWTLINKYNLDPYTKAVLSHEGARNKGEMIFQINCAGCHGVQAKGVVGPSLQDISKRKSKKDLILQVISGKTPPMPKFQPSTAEMADLLIYLQYL